MRPNKQNHARSKPAAYSLALYQASGAMLEKAHEIKLSDKLKKKRSNPAFAVPYVRQRITLELLDGIAE